VNKVLCQATETDKDSGVNMARILRDAGADREGLMGARDWVWRGRYPSQSEEGPVSCMHVG